MTHQQIEQSLLDLNAMVLEGRLMDAFEKYYHEDVVMRENAQPATIGKEANRRRELEFLSNVTEIRGAAVNGLAINGDISFVNWSLDYIHKEWGVRKYSQVSIQRWKDNQIIEETFYYGNS